MGQEYTIRQYHCGRETKFCYCKQNGEDKNNYGCSKVWGQKKSSQGKGEDWKVPESQKRYSEALEP